MASEKQTEANRRNAQKSTGPRTEEGKRKSRLNAFRHGLTGQIDIMTDETRDAHDAFIAGIVLTLRPADPLENQLAHSVAESYWRMNRIPVFENALLAQGDYVRFAHNQDREYSDLERALSAARGFIEDPARFNLLTVYEGRLHRKAQADLKHLREIQAERRAAEKETVKSEPKAVVEVAQPVERENPAAENGFVFSTAGSGSGRQPGRQPDEAAGEPASRFVIAPAQQIAHGAAAHLTTALLSAPATHAQPVANAAERMLASNA